MPATTNKLPEDIIPRKEALVPAHRGGTGKGKEAAVVPKRRSPADDYTKWRSLVERIQSGDERGMEELYSVFSKGIRYYLCRQLGPQELEDKVHDTFLVVVQAIRKGDLREPERLMGFVRTIARRQVASSIERTIQRRKDVVALDDGLMVTDDRVDPEENAITRQKVQIMKEALGGISARDREILTRFYLREESKEEICAAMGLSKTQFRLLKSRAKARFGEMGKRKLARRPLAKLLMRFSGLDQH